MKKYNKSEIMTRAWRMYRKNPNKTWKWCVTRSWAIQKENMQKVTPVEMNRIIQSLKPLRLAATREHFNFLNSKKGKAIMKRSDNDEAKEMLSAGDLCIQDILHKRRFESLKYKPFLKIERLPRKRIQLKTTFEKINIEQYVRENI